MDMDLRFGKEKIALKVDEKNVIDVLMPNHVEVSTSGIDEVKRAILEPIHSERLKDVVRPGEKIVIITSDITRPMPSKTVLPEVLKELSQGGIQPTDIKVVFALGSHRKHTEDEKKYLVGEEIVNTIECIDSDIKDCIHLGNTSSGTPVDIFRPVAEADRRICLGNIEYHYFAGYSGGAKAIMPGVSTREAIQANHSKMVMDGAKAGEMTQNPVRKDIDEVVKTVSIDFILNVVLDEKKNIIKAVAGHHYEAHREGCKFLDRFYKVAIKEKVDIVIVSAGGYPKDINVYQAQKALDNAKHAVREGGIIILAASCREGYGEGVFERWIKRAETHGELIENIQRNFELGGHKAAAIAMVLEKNEIYLVSELEDSAVRKMFMKPFPRVQTALNEAMEKLGPDSRVIIMPFGGSTLPEAIA